MEIRSYRLHPRQLGFHLPPPSIPIAVLWRSLAGVAAIPLFSRILEGLKACPRDARSQIDRLPEYLDKLLGHTPFYLVADAYYASLSGQKKPTGEEFIFPNPQHSQGDTGCLHGEDIRLPRV